MNEIISDIALCIPIAIMGTIAITFIVALIYANVQLHRDLQNMTPDERKKYLKELDEEMRIW